MGIQRLIILAAFCFLQTLAIGYIPKDCFRPKEFYSCGSACQITCETLNQTCPIINIICNDVCYCVEGYARDQTGTCVPIDKCEDRLNGICGENEEYRVDFYLHNDCHEQLLTDLEVPQEDALGCYCIAGYKRAPTGICIPAAECPPKPPAKYPENN
ncbi:PREDICTED: inducible metalloproteinase inhibitor protein-like [Nicrophorus vespilloides]|uniref:Inducible metalloproteinase inhibitor protein-like n=1 Tax=Nicrophorus vespilloides TaxID=110193 RepID=A0ABM1MH34_NICVS|nr:PREDICTED: inducible metalloproteinase inhibitor protein-like [Nicrophorus vespilloides]